MSLFANLMGKIFGHATPATPPPSAPTASSAPTAPPAAPGTAPATSAAVSTPAPAATTSAPPAPRPAEPVDVGAILDGLAAKNSEKLDWKHSIVDMMKLLDMDSSLTARKELATELKYTGDMNDSATMNVWLHKAVMQKLADNGGKIPPGLI
jgi:hypothetical protein